VLAALALTGCTTQVVEENVKPSFQATIEQITDTDLTVRCTLIYPPRDNTHAVWSADTLEFRATETKLPFTFDMTEQDMISDSQETSETWALWWPFTRHHESHRRESRSEAVARMLIPKGTNLIVVLFHGDAAIQPGINFSKTIMIK